MPFETKSTLDDKKEYFKNLVRINTSAILIIVWVIVCGGLSSFYCVVSGADMINKCLKNVPIDTSPVDASASSVNSSAPSVEADSGTKTRSIVLAPWHHKYNVLGDGNEPMTIESSVWFKQSQERAFDNTFFKKRADQYLKDVKGGEDSFFFSKMWVQGICVFPRLVAHDLWFISEWHSFFQKITDKLGWGTLLMSSFILFPIFMVFFAAYNAGAAFVSWGESVIELYKQLYLRKEVEDAIGTTDKNIDCPVQTIIKNLIILFLYACIVPIIGLLTVIPTLAWFAMSLLIAPVYALCLPFKIQGVIIPNKLFPGETSDNKPKTKNMQKEFDCVGVFLSNIYSYAGWYLAFFSILYSIIAGLKQDVYSFIGCIVAMIILFGVFKWYKSAAPDIEVPDTGGGTTAPSVQQNPVEVPKTTPASVLLGVDKPDVDQSGAETIITPVVKDPDEGALWGHRQPVTNQTGGPQIGGGAPSRLRNKNSRKR